MVKSKLSKQILIKFFCVISVMFLIVPAVIMSVGAQPPSVSAGSAILIEASSGEVLFEKKADDLRSMASTTKIMTALVALENGNIDDKVTISSAAVGIEGSSVYLYADEELTLGELLYAVMLESANDAAAAVAIDIAGSVDAFANMMNSKAAELGLSHTHFTNPHGLDNESHYTSARDLAILTVNALKNETFRKIVATRRIAIPLHNGQGARLLLNHNKLLRLYSDAIGVKTGFTKKSGRCLVSAAERDGVTLIAVTLDAPDDWRDHTTLLDYGFSMLERVTLAEAGTLSYALPVIGGTSPYIFVNNASSVHAVLPRGHGEIQSEVQLKNFYYAPLSKSQPLGKVIWSCDGKKIAECELTASFDIPKEKPKSFWNWLTGLLGLG